jgi:catechol 2,3-dioxygenase-like lactoylglutathione lyase family enzyme
MVIAPKVMAQARKPPLTLRGLNHLSLRVSNIQRSLEFYQRLFGMAIQARQAAIPVLRIGTGHQFIALFTGGNAKPGIGHFCMAVEDFNPDRVMQTLAEHGVAKTVPGTAPLTAWVRMRGEADGGAKEGTPELYFNDPDGIQVQLQGESYCGVAGVGGQVCSVTEQPRNQPLATRALNHVALSCSDQHRSLQFYQRLFGMPIQARQGPSLMMAAGSRPDFIVLNQAGTNAFPNNSHFCLTMDGFDPDRVMKTLVGLGLKESAGGGAGPMTARVRWRQVSVNGGGPGSPKGTPELYFTDPDNIGGQIQDARYCGGSGALGEVCP